MSAVSEAGPVKPGQSGAHQDHEHKLDAGALHWFDSIVMAIAGSAPAYSISVSTGVIIGAVGFASPAALSLIALLFTDRGERTKALTIWGALAGLGQTPAPLTPGLGG